MLDAFGTEYVLVLGADVEASRWEADIASLANAGFPIAVQILPVQDGDSPYTDDGAVLVRPDGIIADHWLDGEVDEATRDARLARTLPFAR